ncbi:MAG: sigma-54-dependent transcriptional regulator [bacterium]
MVKEKILIVDDEESLIKVLSIAFKKHNYYVHEATSAKQALKILEQEPIDVVISDIKMPEVSGLDLLEKVKKNSPNTGFILLTAYASLDSAIKALRSGADDYLTKPFEVEELLIRMDKVMSKHRVQREADYLRSLFIKGGKKIVGLEDGLKEVADKLRKAAPVDATILLQGESGTGKELLAKLIHQWSSRNKGPLVTVNCAAIPETLLESELFGHKKGSFTGANADKEGLFKIADGGTIFLDEIGDVSPLIQVKLLRAIQEKEITPLGATSSIKIDVRIVVATNRDLKKMVDKNEFREDLFYRINVVPVYIPPLRERQQDIINLAEFFVDKFSKKHNLKKSLSAQAKRYLITRKWKGNVRELENVLEKVVVLGEQETITVSDFEEELKLNENYEIKTLDEIEKNAIIKTLQSFEYDKKKTAEMLGINLSTLYRKLKKYAI